MLRTIKWLFLVFSGLVLILVITIAFTTVDPRQDLEWTGTHPIIRDMESIFSTADVDSLDSLYGKNKILAPGYELQCLLALAYHPELRHLSISFELTTDTAPMESTLRYASLLGARDNRKYRILLNDDHDTYFDPILLRNLSFDAQVGILAHELGHTVYYHQLNTLQMIRWGLMYALDKEYRAIHERSTDRFPVYRGLGWQIYEYAKFIRSDPTTIEFYQDAKGFLDRYYLTPEEIKDEMEKSGRY